MSTLHINRQKLYKLPVLDLIVILLFFVVVRTNITSSAEETSINLAERMPFYSVIIIGLFRALLSKKILNFDYKLVGLLVFFFIYLVLFTAISTDYDVKSIIFPNYGMISWLLVGLSCKVSIVSISHWLILYGKKATPTLIITAPCILLIFLAASIGNGDEISRVGSYQFVADNASCFLIMAALAINRWGNALELNKKILFVEIVTIAYLIIGTYFVMLIVAMNSTGIVAVWVSLISIIILVKFFRGSIVRIVPVLIAFLITFFYLSSSSISEKIISETRFKQIFSGGNISEFNSVASRMSIIDNFSDQFMVNPLFGNMQAELFAGNGEGNYVHSLPLSLLTHTGVLGFATIAFLVIKIFRRDIKLNNSFFDILLFLAIIINGTIFAFFSWAPFWVTLGYMIGDVNFTKYPPKKWS